MLADKVSACNPPQPSRRPAVLSLTFPYVFLKLPKTEIFATCLYNTGGDDPAITLVGFTKHMTPTR